MGDATNTVTGATQDIGNLLDSDRNSIGVGGTLNNSNADVDFFTFVIDYDDVQGWGEPDGFGTPIAQVGPNSRTFPVSFDIDYADGLARPDTTISVFDSTGTLIYLARESNIKDDQPAPGEGVDFDDLTRGTVGKLDPFLGTIQLPAGQTNGLTSERYFVAVSSNTQVPVQLNATFTGAGAANPLIRLEPVNSLQRIAEDHIGSQGYSANGIGINPTTQLFDVFDNITIDTSVTPFTLQDVTLFTADDSFLFTVDPQFGGNETNIGTIREPAVPNNPIRSMTDVVLRSDGRLIGISGNRVLEIDSGGNATGGTTSTLLSLTNIPTTNPSINQNGLPINAPRINALRTAMNHTSLRPSIQAFTFERTGFNNVTDLPNYSVAHMVTETGRSVDGVLRTFQQLYRGDRNGSAPAGFEGYLADPNVPLTIAEDFDIGVDNGGNAAGLLMQAVVPGARGNDIELIIGTTTTGTRSFVSGPW